MVNSFIPGPCTTWLAAIAPFEVIVTAVLAPKLPSLSTVAAVTVVVVTVGSSLNIKVLKYFIFNVKKC